MKQRRRPKAMQARKLAPSRRKCDTRSGFVEMVNALRIIYRAPMRAVIGTKSVWV